MNRLQILIEITTEATPPKQFSDRLRCELWHGCESEFCRQNGCINFNGGNHGGAACPPPSSFIPCSTSTN